MSDRQTTASRAPGILAGAALALAIPLCLRETPSATAAEGADAVLIAGTLKAPGELRLPVPDDGELYRVVARAGKVKGQLRVRFGGDAKGAATLTVTCIDMTYLNHHWGTSKVPKGLQDAGLTLLLSGVPGWKRGYRKDYFVRPDPYFYCGDDLKAAIANWDEPPPASQHWFALEIHRNDSKLALFVDGRFYTTFPTDRAWRSIDISLTEDAEIRRVHRTQTVETHRYVPVNISVNANRGPMQVTETSIPAGVSPVAGIPVHVTPPTQHVDVGRARWLRQAQDSMSFYSPYYKRSCWDSNPETVMFSVPKRFYNYAHLLCAVEPDKAKSPTMSIRIARYRRAWDGSGATQADTTVRVDPDDPVGCTAITRVGSIKAKTGRGSRKLPLYLVSCPLKTGELADYLGEDDWDTPYERTDYLYLEFTREIRTRVSSNYGVFEKLPLGPQSGVHLFGVTLEKAPMSVAITSREVGNIFYQAKNPSLDVQFTNPAKSELELSMKAQVTDFYGRTIETESQLKLKPGVTRVPFDLRGQDLGWHHAEFAFTDAEGREVWSQPLTFALLPPDARRAGNESPFGTWWFAGSHYCERDATRVMPIVQKMGFRHVTPPPHDPKSGCTSETLARYKVTPSMMRKIKTEDAEGEARKFMQQWPGTRFAMIFHETGLEGLGLEFPPELLGKPPLKLEGDNLKRYEVLLEHAMKRAEVIRKVAPDAKIILGNGGTPFNVHWLRTKLPRKYWDCIGMETAIQLFHPEAQPHGWNQQALWIAKRMREIYGYDDFPIASCYEYDYRSTAPGALSLWDQANWYVRDVLHGLAYRMPTINVALIMDCNSSYYTSRWGATGVCFRSPDMMPKPSFVALATLTQELDQAEYQGYLDTGSHSLYCLEFRKGKEFVYVLWTTRGERRAEIGFPQASGKFRLTDLMGRSKEGLIVEGATTLDVTEAPVFLTLASELKSVQAGAVRHQPVAMKNAQVFERPDGPWRWRVAPEPDEGLDNWCAYSPLQQGKFTLGGTKQGSLEVTLQPQPEIPDVVGRYAVLEPINGPVKIPGEPKRIGIWVKGNSGWGRVMFEVLDAKGRKWSSNGWEEAPNSWDMSDWEARTCINFDGWNFISVGLDLHHPSGYYAPDFRHWRCHGDNGITNEIAYPLKFSRLYLIMREKLVYVTDMVPANSMTIELRDLTVELD